MCGEKEELAMGVSRGVGVCVLLASVVQRGQERPQLVTQGELATSLRAADFFLSGA